MGIIRCFTTSKANAFENLLEPLQKLLRLSPPIALSLAHPDLFGRILQKLQSSKAVVRLNLLRILRSICDASDEQGSLITLYGLTDTVLRLSEVDGAVLVRNMAGELIKSSETDRNGLSGSKRRPARRTSSSTTPPSLIHSQSVPATPSSDRSAHSTSYLNDRAARSRGPLNGPLAYRPGSRNGSVSSGNPNIAVASSGPAARSRLPRTTSSRPSRTSMLTSPGRESSGLGVMSPQDQSPMSPMPVPNSRRRRRINGEVR